MDVLSWLLTFFLLYTSSKVSASSINARGIFDPLLSAVDSLLGISSTDSTPIATTTADKTPLSTAIQTTSILTSVPTTTSPAAQTMRTTTVLQTSASSEVHITPSIDSQPTTNPSTSALPTTTGDTTSLQNPTPTTFHASSRFSSSTSPASSLSTSITPVVTTTPRPHTTSADPVHGLSSSSAIPSQPSTSSQSQVSKAGAAVAIIAGLLLLAGIIYLIVRFNPTVNAKYTQWRESRKQRSGQEGNVADEEKGNKFEVLEKPVFGKAVVVNIPSPKIGNNHQSQASETTIVKAKSPSCDSCHKQKRPRFSFQFFSPPSPQRPESPQTIRRKPVPAPLNLQPHSGSTNPSIGLAVPLGSDAKRPPNPLSPRSWMGRKRISYFEDYSNAVRQ